MAHSSSSSSSFSDVTDNSSDRSTSLSEEEIVVPNFAGVSTSTSSSSIISQASPLSSSATASSLSSHPEYNEHSNDAVANIAASLDEPDNRVSDLKEYFIGLKTAQEAEALTHPTSMHLYYQMPQDGMFASEVNLFIVYRSTDGQAYHFPIVEEEGRWRVKYGESKNVSYPTIGALVKHHLVYAIVSPYGGGAVECFEIWKDNAEE